MKNSKNPRDVLKQVIIRSVIGPANDVFIDLGDEEILSAYPLNKYSSAVIFPPFSEEYGKIEEAVDSEIEFPGMEIEDIQDRDSSGFCPDVLDQDVGSKEVELDNDFSRSELYPFTFGLSFCLDSHASDFNVHLGFGSYSRFDPSKELHPNRKIRLSFEDYSKIKALNAGNAEYLGALIGYDHELGAVYLKRKLIGNSQKPLSGDYYDFDTIKRKIRERLSSSKGAEKERYTALARVLMSVTPLYRHSWIRRQHSYEHCISVSSCDSLKSICQPCDTIDQCPISYNLHVQMISHTSNYYIFKIMVENTSDTLFKGSILRRSPNRNQVCMFQSEIQIKSIHIIPLPKQHIPSYATLSDKIIECQYRDLKTYSLAHNCSCTWSVDGSELISIKTDFLPSIIPPVTTNLKSDVTSDILNVKKNSDYGDATDEEIVSNLETFASSYHSWIMQQGKDLDKLGENYKEAGEEILRNQNTAYCRMMEGIKILGRPEFMKLYRLANSAMLVNMIKLGYKAESDAMSRAGKVCYHPFQLAFLLTNFESIVNVASQRRENEVDLLWFPTGGGKTEAYFLVAAFSLLFRRLTNPDTGLGTSVIMRYTLRLLTAQQFERASRLILSLNYVCSIFAPELIEKKMYSIGLWIGSASSPNLLFEGDQSANEINSDIIEAGSTEEALKKNKFPLSNCPWCGESLIGLGRSGFSVLKGKFEIKCLSPSCLFNRELPIDLVDESLYANPPSLLFATVDKLARLAKVRESSAFFGVENGYMPPDLIIQDELHLLSGPLGSITALFEGVIDMLCKRGGHKPRIIASTATIKNADAQVQGLFGARHVFTFPPPGLSYDDSFFAKRDPGNLNREYIGLMPTGRSVTAAQVELLALLLYGRHEVDSTIDEDMDNYWTVVSYYNSLRELGRMFNKARDEVQQSYVQMVARKYPDFKRKYIMPPKELTSRISGYDVKKVLSSLESPCLKNNDLGTIDNSAIELVFATNMISVGLDIERLNLLLINGQPKSTSEYIQVTSRIARNHPGLVITLFNPFKARDKSHYESFYSFHAAYYRYVEPTSITPYTRVSLHKMMPTLLSAYLQIYKGLDSPSEVRNEDFDEFVQFMTERIKDDSMVAYLKRRVKDHIVFLREKLGDIPNLTFKTLTRSVSSASFSDYDDDDWLTMNSMREISPNAVFKIIDKQTKKKRTSVYE